MLSNLGEVNLYRKPIEPQIFLAKPNREIISKISEAYNIKQRDLILQLNDITFDLPYEIDFNGEQIRNSNADLLKERYLLKVVRGIKIEWFVITKLNDNMDEDKDYMTVEASSLGYQLRGRLLKGYHNDSAHAKTVLTEVLVDTNWRTDYIDADFELTYREFDFQDTNVLDAVYKIAETYNAIILWDTVNRTISLVKPELFGINKGLKFSYGHYLRSLGKESDSDMMVTRLKAYGKDGLSIQNVNPTGQPYIENFSYFMFPFERDENRNVVNHSEYMSDSLCHALIDYSELIESKKSEFSSLLTQKESLQSTLTTKENELKTLQIQEAAVDNIVSLQQADNNMWFYKYIHSGSSVLNTTLLNPLNAYVFMIKVNDTNNLTVKVNGNIVNTVAEQWMVIGKTKLSSIVAIETSGTSINNEIYIQIANITDIEYSTSGNETALIEKYCIDNKKMQIAAKKAEIANVINQINSVESNITTLRELMSFENNFTSEQIEELNDYIIEGTFSDEKYIDEHDLYKDAQEKFLEFQKPQLVINISVVDFLRIVEEQHNWNKLVLGDIVTIDYEKIGVKVTARIIGIEYDYENYDINLTIANVKEITDNRKLFEKYIYNSNYTSIVVSSNKDRWGQAVKDSSEISQLFENFWNKVTNEVNFASNEYVTIDRKGLTIIDPNDPNRFLRATHGVLALTRSGGLRYETAITPDGIIAERLMGKILTTQRVIIGDDDGIWLTEGAKTIITDRCNREVMKIGLYDENPDKFGIKLNRYATSDCADNTVINRVIVDRDEGFVIERKDGSNWDKTAWLDIDGYFNGRGVKIDYMSGILNNGITLDNTDGLVVTRNDIAYRTKLNATEGIKIQKNIGTDTSPTWVDRFYIDLNGNLTLKGFLQVGEGNAIFTANNEGIALGSGTWSTAPFRVDLNGNAYMNKLTAETAEIRSSWFRDGHIVGSDLTIGSGNNVFKVFPLQGIWAGNQNFDQAPFSVTLDGTLKARKAIITDGNNKLLIDSENAKLYMNNWDIDGVGKLTAEMIAVTTITAAEGYISNLTVSRLVTLGKDAAIGQYVDYIKIEDNYMKFITARVNSKQQSRDSKGRLLWWTDSSRQITTTEDMGSGLIAYSYSFDDIKEKRIISFDGSGALANPKDIIGNGDGGQGNSTDGLHDSGKAYTEKGNGFYKQAYYNSNYAKERSITLFDDSVDLLSEEGDINNSSKNYSVFTDNGFIKLVHSSGSKFEINATGDMISLILSNGSAFTLNSNGLSADITGDINLTATGNVTLGGSQIHFIA
ncbi:phage tail spike protein [Paenibacillus naphthalenovorans]|uniref:Phage minor structural protein n=1 Tax=Paenibacillus naphthalenovorans TaxID=162209 RepID=A0A0U2M460_9BACL|nr:phage tail spike protein [Paenibacillus naphthalenovorans]ALS22320.1 phage minor structural protein [Paenibacillus naphthalenovorans]